MLAAFGEQLCDITPDAASHTGYGGQQGGRPIAVMQPPTTADVVAIVRFCRRHRIGIVPQGGLSGLAGGAIPTPAQRGRVIVVAMSRMARIRAIDADNRTVAVDAGCTVDQVEAAVAAHGLCLPLRIGSSASAQIGGVISTNAGGLRSWRHGNARRIVLGVEAVLADGSVWSSMRAVRKANLGIDVGSLLIGAEGCIGILTGAVLEIAPRPQAVATAFLALHDVAAVVPVFRRLESAGELETFELMSRTGLGMVAAVEPDRPLPLAGNAPWYVLAEWAPTSHCPDLATKVEDDLGAAMEAGMIADAAIARSERERIAFWRIRERHGTCCRQFGRPSQHDVAVPVSAIPAFIRAATTLAENLVPAAQPVPICHVGDGNVHFDVLLPLGDATGSDEPLAKLRRAIHDLAISHGGSFSAEHGIGTERLDELRRLSTPDNYAAMRAIKQALDPLGLMNPGKVLFEPDCQPA